MKFELDRGLSPRLVLSNVLLALSLASGHAWAQPAQQNGSIYSCIDSTGRRITSDRPIPACLDREQRELGKSGVVKRVVPPSYTAEERARLDEQKKAETCSVRAWRKKSAATRPCWCATPTRPRTTRNAPTR